MPEMSFPALAGRMGDRDFYMAVMTLHEVARFFEPTSPTLPPELRAQRPLQEKRIPDITAYIQEKENDWVFGSITVSFNGDSEYSTSKQSLRLSTDTEFVIVDGQHRVAAIKEAVAEDPTLRKQQIGVMLIPFESLDRNQQVFSDLNRTVQKTSRSLDILYDHDDPLNGLVLSVANRVALFQGRVEKNQTSLAVRSRYFVTLSSLYDACRELLGGERAMSGLKSDDAASAAEELCVEYWDRLSDLIGPWRAIKANEMKPAEARIEYIVSHSVAFWALGAAGSQVLGIRGRDDWDGSKDWGALTPLSAINWQKTNPDWQGIAMLGSAVVTRRQTRVALARRISHLIDPSRFPDAPRVLERS